MTHPGVTKEGRFDPLHPIVLKYVVRVMGLQNGVSAILFGGSLLMPWDTFSVSDTYSVMARHWNEDVWGGAYVVLGVVQIFAHMLPLTVLWRLVLMLAWSYVGLVVLFFFGDYRSTGWPQYSWDALFAGTLFALEGARALRRWRHHERV